LDKEPATHNDNLGGYLVYYKIDPAGNITKGDLFDYKREGIRFQPANFERIGTKSIVNRAYKGKQSRVVIISQK